MRIEDVSLREMQNVWERNKIAGRPRSPEMLELIDVLRASLPGAPRAVLLPEGEDSERWKGMIRRAAKVLGKSVDVAVEDGINRVYFEVTAAAAGPASGD